MTLEKQRELTQEYLQNQGLREPLSIMSVQILEHLSRELVRLCDSVEKHGLVDYQMGVAEEEIMDRKYPCETAFLLLVTIANVCVCAAVLIRCLSLLDPDSATTGAESSVSASRDR